MAVIRRHDKKVKTLAAVVGGGAAVTLGVIGAVVGGSTPAATPTIVSVGEMTLGATETAGYSATLATSLAVPTQKATPPCGFKSGC